MIKNTMLKVSEHSALRDAMLPMLHTMEASRKLDAVLIDTYDCLIDYETHKKLSLLHSAVFLPTDIRYYVATVYNDYLNDLIGHFFPLKTRVFILPLTDIEIPASIFYDVMLLHVLTFVLRLSSELQTQFNVLPLYREVNMQMKKHFSERISEHPAFEACYMRKAPSVSVITDWEGFVPRQLDFECAHAKSKLIADPIVHEEVCPSAPVPYIEEKELIHNGQMKLLVFELAALAAISQKKIYFDTVVYLGAAPGWHIETVAKAYNTVQFFCIDPQPVIPSDRVVILPWTSIPGDRFDMLRGHNRHIVVISDIFSSVPGHEMTLVEEYVTELKQDFKVVAVTEKQFLHYTATVTPVRRDAEQWFQCWTTGASAEERSLLFSGNMETVLRSTLEKDNKMNYFRSVVRKHACRDDKCYDCHYTSLVLNLTFAFTQCDLSEDFRNLADKRAWIHPMVGVLRKLKTYDKLVEQIERGAKVLTRHVYESMSLVAWEGQEYLFIGTYKPVLINKHFRQGDEFFPDNYNVSTDMLVDGGFHVLDTGWRLPHPPVYRSNVGMVFYTKKKQIVSTKIEDYSCPVAGCFGGGSFPLGVYLLCVDKKATLTCGHSITSLSRHPTKSLFVLDT